MAQIPLVSVFLLLVQSLMVFGLEDKKTKDLNIENSTSAQGKDKDLYVIRKVVYEIGILTDADNSSFADNRTHEEIDVSFFDPEDNGTFVDLSNIPFPVETNVSGVTVTGIVKTDLGSIIFPKNGTIGELSDSVLTPLFPDKQIKVTRNITTVDRNQGSDLLKGLNDVLGLTDKFRKPSKGKDSAKEHDKQSEEDSVESLEEQSKEET